MTEEEKQQNKMMEEAYKNGYNPVTELDNIHSELINLLKNGFWEYALDEDEKQKPFGFFKEYIKKSTEDEQYQTDLYNENAYDKIVARLCNKFIKIANQIAKNPSKELIEQKVSKLGRELKDHPKAILTALQFLFTYIDEELLLDLGHTSAWIFLDKHIEEHSKFVIDTREVLEWKKGDMRGFYDGLISIGILSIDTPFSSLQSVFKKEIKQKAFVFAKQQGVKKPLLFAFELLQYKEITDLEVLSSFDSYIGFYTTQKANSIQSLRTQGNPNTGQSSIIYRKIEKLIDEVLSNSD